MKDGWIVLMGYGKKICRISKSAVCYVHILDNST